MTDETGTPSVAEGLKRIRAAYKAIPRGSEVHGREDYIRFLEHTLHARTEERDVHIAQVAELEEKVRCFQGWVADVEAKLSAASRDV